MTKDLQQKKEQLKKQLQEIKNLERKELIEKHYPKFKKLEGNCYKKKNHCGSPKKPSDYWYEYTKVLEIKEEHIYSNNDHDVSSHCIQVSFYTYNYGNFSIIQENSYVHLLGKKITEKEFNKAFNKQLSRAKKLLTKKLLTK